MKKTAWVAGASGLVGSHLMTLLAQHPNYHKVIALVRTQSNAAWAQLPKVEQWTVDYEHLQPPQPECGVDDLFCALGSTTRKTPDKKVYYQIDVQFPLNFAELGRQYGAHYYGLVSAHGANTRSLSFYFQMKGELEQQLQQLGYPHLAIARPGLLKGQRGEFRMGERVAEFVANWLPGNYQAIDAADVAAALIGAANSNYQGVEVLASKTMQGALRGNAQRNHA